MRIWIINHYAATPETGPGNRHCHFARHLAARGHSVAVIAARPHHLLRDVEAAMAAPAVEETDGYRFVRLDIPRYRDAHDRRRVAGWFAFAWRLRRLPGLLSETPDVILCSSPSLVAYLGAERLARRTGARLVFEVRDIWPLSLVELGGTSPRHPFIRLLQAIEDRALRRSDRVISNLPLSVEHMVSRGMDRGKFAWVPNGFAAADLAAPQPLDAATREALGTDGGFTVGYTGTIGHANALGTMLDAAALLRDHGDIRFVLVGEGRAKPDLQRRAEREGLGNVRFVPAVPKREVPSILKELDACFIGLSNQPLFRFGVSPNKLFDYLAAGRPILYAIDSGDYRPVAEHGAGLQVPPEDPEALAGAVLDLKAMTPEDRAAMGRKGREAAFGTYEYAALAQKLEEILRSVSERP